MPHTVNTGVVRHTDIFGEQKALAGIVKGGCTDSRFPPPTLSACILGHEGPRPP